MNRPNKCKNCQWYGKPYWSIINPCDSCPAENDYKTIIQIDGEPVFKETLTEEEIKKAMTNKSIFELTIEEKDKEIEEQTEYISTLQSIIEDDKENYKLLDKEIERLNKECDTYMKIATKKDNIINELERYLISMFNKTQDTRYCDDLMKLGELKEKSDDE